MPKLKDTRPVIGIWIQLIPHSLVTEGIGRLLIFYINGAVQAGYRFVIACPSWFQKDLNDFIEELDPSSRSAVSILMARRRPSFFILFKPQATRRKGPLRLAVWFAKFKKQVKQSFYTWCSRQSLFSLMIFTLLALPLIIPIAVVAAFYLSFLAIRQFVRRSQHPLFVRMKNHIRGTIAFYRHALSSQRSQLHQLAMVEEYKQLAKAAAARRNVMAWFVPNSAWSGAARIGKPLVVAVPDYVLEDFPLSFVDMKNADQPRRQIARTLKAADCTISFRQHVRDAHVVEYFGFPGNRAFVVPHAPVDLSKYLAKLETKAISASDSAGNSLRIAAADFVRDHFRKRYLKGPVLDELFASYLPDFAFEDAKFILVSTRFRSYKNILRVVEAVQMLLRKRLFNIKLFVTGCFDDEIAKFVDSQCLNYDVIPLYHVPADVHAYLYHLAQLTVHPSFFEGGFPFVFSEAVSVGTPVVLPNESYITDVIDADTDGNFLFDAYSAEDLADKIQYALENRDSLLSRQTEIFKEMNKRTWSDVANEYNQVMQFAAGIHGKQNHSIGGPLVPDRSAQDQLLIEKQDAVLSGR